VLLRGCFKPGSALNQLRVLLNRDRERRQNRVATEVAVWSQETRMARPGLNEKQAVILLPGRRGVHRNGRFRATALRRGGC
jgi:hypothetical protein